MKKLKLNFKHKIRYNLPFLRQKTPVFDGYVKHFIWGDGAEARTEIPKIIWIYWHEEKISSISTQLCIEEIIRLNPDFEINILHQNNVESYLPEFPVSLFERQANFSSDLIRLMLLEKFGGIYLDATTLLSSSLHWVLNQQREDKSEALVYYTDENTTEEKFPMLDTWFIGAIPNSTFIRAWRQEYQACITSNDPLHYYQDNEILPLSEFPMEISYYYSYMAGQIVIRRNQEYRLSLNRAEDDAFLYGLNVKRKWSEVAMSEILLLNPKSYPQPNVVKIIRFSRRRLDFWISRGFFKPTSWLGEVLYRRTKNPKSSLFA